MVTAAQDACFRLGLTVWREYQIGVSNAIRDKKDHCSVKMKSKNDANILCRHAEITGFEATIYEDGDKLFVKVKF